MDSETPALQVLMIGLMRRMFRSGFHPGKCGANGRQGRTLCCDAAEPQFWGLTLIPGPFSLHPAIIFPLHAGRCVVAHRRVDVRW